MAKEMKARRKRAMGGTAKGKEHLYNAKGAPEASDAEDDTTKGFKRGGMPKKRKDGGHVEGKKSEMRLDKRARGGATRAKGGAVYSSAKNVTESMGKSTSGHEGESPGPVD